MQRARNLSIAALLLATTAVSPVFASLDDEQVDPRWLDKLDETDRAYLEENIGHAPPEMTADLKWIAGSAQSWDNLRGKVVIVQSWTVDNGAGRGAPVRTRRAVEPIEAGDDLVLIALHTPEGAEKAAVYVENRDPGMPVILDERGVFCDEFGFYKRPANIIIDRGGVIRYAGLNPRGLNEAAKALLAEPFDPSKKPQPRPKDDKANEPEVEFPTYRDPVRSADDLRGRRAPEMQVQQWLNGTPDARGKVTVIDFWATWCGPCVRAIPHMNELAARFRDDVVCVGLSNEAPGTVQTFMRSTPMNYYVAIDKQARVQKGFGVRGIPHVAVISADWVVRWQGHAASLTPQVLQQIVDANRGLAAGSPGGRYRWSG